MIAFQFKPFTWDDLPALVDLINLVGETDQVEERYTPETLRAEMVDDFGAAPTEDCWLVVLPDGDHTHATLIGYGYVGWQDAEPERIDDPVWGFAWGAVHPDYRRRGIGRQIMQRIDTHFAGKVEAAQFPNGKGAYIQRYLSRRNTDELQLATELGYVPVRSSYRMSVDLTQPLTPIAPPAGFTLRPFDPDQHAQAVYEVDREAFMQGGGKESPMGLAAWHARYIAADHFDPDLWVVVWRDETPVGMAFSQPFDPIQTDLAWITHLAVLPAWRGRGLGEALLRQSFYACQQAGFTRAALGVRAESETAVKLYVRAGMTQTAKYTHYRRVLR
ncbi:MAG: GNAT family N-acetyltransferase [Anaerolineae bacterium]|nr:GNAT family N-acetyltransferase [Anaerolineae bacterium]